MTPGDIKQSRESLGLTQQALANLLGVHQVVLARWESGQHAPPPYLLAAIRSIGYQLLVRRNQPILDAHRASLETLDRIVREIGSDNLPPHIPMFDEHGDLIFWYLLDNDAVYAIGEWVPPKWGTRGSTTGYLIPSAAHPKPTIRLPDWLKGGYGPPDLVKRRGPVDVRAGTTP